MASEETFLERSLTKHATPGQTLLDIGCGYSRFHQIVVSCGLTYIGVDKNPRIVRDNNDRGIHCLAAHAGEERSEPVDVLVLSHIIEHFDHENLVRFVNKYLPKLRIDGIVIIFTPVLHRGFYDDFDHVKPYNPKAIRQAFIDRQAQTQEFGIVGEFAEIDRWMKRDTLWHSYRDRRWMHFLKVPLSLLTTITFGRVGRLTGYGVVLKKIND